MRSAGNFSPEWGYLAPAPSLLRTARVVIVATAVGATAGAAVVLSLVERPVVEADRTPAHAIVTSVQASPIAAPPQPTATAITSSVALPLPAPAPRIVERAAPAQMPAPAPRIVERAAPVQMPVQPEPAIAVPVTPPGPPIATQSASVTTEPPAAAGPGETMMSRAADVVGPQPDASAGTAPLAEPPIEASRSEVMESSIIATEPAKKTKHASVQPISAGPKSKPKPAPTLGSVLKNLFGTHTAASNSNRGL